MPGAKGSIRFHLDLGLFCFSFFEVYAFLSKLYFISLFHNFTF